jgi:hypothetical protein
MPTITTTALQAYAASSAGILAEPAFCTAFAAAIQSKLNPHDAKRWVWLSADAPHLPATARAAAVALGVGLGGVPLLQRLKLRAQALHFCLKRRALIKRYRQLRLDLTQLNDHERRLRFGDLDAFAQGGALHVAQASQQTTQG